MSVLTQLRASRDSYAVKLRDFIRIFTNSPHVLICFFEGEDVKYYGPRLDMLRPDLHWESVNCGGKGVVLKLWNLINTHELYSPAKTAFFFDKDFDDVGSHPVAKNVYITPCYSVENLYVTESAAKRVLRSEFNLNERPDEDGMFAKCFELFQGRLDEFLDAIQLANSWILFHRQAEAQQGATSRLNLASLNPNQMVSVTLQAVTATYTLFDLEAAVGNALPASEAQLAALAASFDQANRHLFFRGKFQSFFMRSFFSRLQLDAHSDLPTCFPCKRRVPFTISDRNFLSDLSQHADTPECLRTFFASLN